MNPPTRHRIGSLEELRARGTLTGKVGAQPVCVFWSGDEAHAVEDRCPHLGFPLHRGTVADGLLTCHWHHARFDLVTGGTLDPFADDVPAFPVELDGDDVCIVTNGGNDAALRHQKRLKEGLEQSLTLVIAKAVLGLYATLGESEATESALAAGVDFGVRFREQGWGPGLSVLTAMANVLPALDPADRPLALVHGLAFVSRDTRGQRPHFAVDPLPAELPIERLESWYRRFVDTRSGDAAERTLATAAAASGAGSAAGAGALAQLMGAAATDHVFIDGGHTIDFVNKAFEALDHLGPGHVADGTGIPGGNTAEGTGPPAGHAAESTGSPAGNTAESTRSLAEHAAEGTGPPAGHTAEGPGIPAGRAAEGTGPPARHAAESSGPPAGIAVLVLPSLAHQTAGASRSEETGAWRHPDDLAGLLARAADELPDRLARARGGPRIFEGDKDVDALAHAVLGEDPAAIVGSLDEALDRGATAEELARAVAYAAALRILGFHVQNDHGDWDVVHHAFTTANAVHQLVIRTPSAELLRGVYQGALRVYLDRFLNVPPARHPAQVAPPAGEPAAALRGCWDRQGMVDEAGAIVYRWASDVGQSNVGQHGDDAVLAALGSALLAEDAEFHWFQTYEAALRQSRAWPAGSEQAAAILAGAARFLAAHTPTRRELPQVVRIAARLGRGDPLYDIADA